MKIAITSQFGKAKYFSKLVFLKMTNYWSSFKKSTRTLSCSLWLKLGNLTSTIHTTKFSELAKT